MAMVQFTHIGKAVVAVNPDLVFAIESFGQGTVGGYTRIRSTGEAHVDVKENFATVIALLGLTVININDPPSPRNDPPGPADGDAGAGDVPEEDPTPGTGFSWDQ